jgi:ubiquinone/menaquinone biosynthesis C-methylase UbiE
VFGRRTTTEEEVIFLSTNPETTAADLQSDVPAYLTRHYWWAYVHPSAVWVFERQWLVNLILWGNFRRLRDAAIDLLGNPIHGRTLQVACVYGDFTQRLLARHAPDAALDVLDVLPVQLENLSRKLGPDDPRVALCLGDSAELNGPDACYDQVLVFFLLHEQPEEVRRRTLIEALRVTKPGGRLVFVDYHCPHPANPLRFFMRPLLRTLEPFALDLWTEEIAAMLPAAAPAMTVRKRTFFGGLYQLVEVCLAH